MSSIRKCTRCERFENSMNRWVEIEIEILAQLVIDSSFEVIHTICPDCEADAKKETKPIGPLTGGGAQ